MPLGTGVPWLCGLFVVAALSGCANDTENYCDALGDQKQAIAALAGKAGKPQPELFESVAIFQGLQEEAPGDMADEWDTFLFAWEGLADAFDAAGASPDDYQRGDVSNGVSQEETRAIEDAAQELRSPRVVEAVRGIEQHASGVCDVDLVL